LSRVGADVSATGVYQTQARQHALLGLSRALGELERFAGNDDLLTGMAGVGGIPAGAGQPRRHWAAVWDGNGQFFRWLASGADEPLLTNEGDSVLLVGSGSLGVDGNDREHVRVRLETVAVPTRQGGMRRLGRYGWWAGDEGVKLSISVPSASAPTTDGRHSFSALAEMPDSAGTDRLGRLLTYEQIELIGVPPGDRRRNFHVLSLTHYGWAGTTRLAGRLNINSTSERYWSGVAETYNGLKGPGAPTILNPAGFGRAISESFHAADPGAGKAEGGPFPSVDLFLNSVALTNALPGPSSLLLSFGDVMRPWLAVRSDTFRVRAYGEALNSSDSARSEAGAWCEAIVQRTKDDPTATEGRFMIIRFRWLGPDDI
jgi:hypothetical protein